MSLYCCRRDGERRKFINARYKILLWQMLGEAPIVTAGKACSIAMLSTVYALAETPKTLPSGTFVVECAEDQLQRTGLAVSCVFTATLALLVGLALSRVPGLCAGVPGQVLAELVAWTTNACFQVIRSALAGTADNLAAVSQTGQHNNAATASGSGANATNTTNASSSQTAFKPNPLTRVFAGLAITATTVVALAVWRRPFQWQEQDTRETEQAAERAGEEDGSEGSGGGSVGSGGGADAGDGARQPPRVHTSVVDALQGAACASASASEQSSAARRQRQAKLPVSQLFAKAMALSAAYELAQGILPYVGQGGIALHYLSVAVAARWRSSTTCSTAGRDVGASAGRAVGAHGACAHSARLLWLTAVGVCGQVLTLLSAFACAEAINATINPNGITYEATYSTARVLATIAAFAYTLFTAWWSLRWMARRLDRQDRGEAEQRHPVDKLSDRVRNLLTYGQCAAPPAHVQSAYTAVFVESNNVAVGWAFERMCGVWICGITSLNISSKGDKTSKAGLGLTTVLLVWAYSTLLSCGMLRRSKATAARRAAWCDKLYALRMDPDAHDSDSDENAGVSMAQIRGGTHNPSVSGVLLRTRFG